MKSKETSRKHRLFACMVVFLAGYFVLSLRVWQLHMSTDERVVRLKERQVQYSAKLSLRRGSIFDSQGRELALSAKVPSVFADPYILKDSRRDIRRLALLLKVNENYVNKRLKKGSTRFAWIKRHLDPTIPREPFEDIDGVYVTDEWKRFYPERELAAQVLGVVNRQGRGVDGVEAMYNKYLDTRDTTITSEKDARGRAIFSADSNIQEGKEGADIYLTIDAAIQHITEREIKKAAIESQSKSAIGVVMDPFSGRIYAMASYPFVNLNRMEDATPKQWKNQALVDVFEPGSTFKIFTMAAALEHHLISERQLFDCREGSLKIGRKIIRNVIKKDILSPAGILKYSSNVGVARIGLDLGPERLDQTIRRMGFGERTGVSFPMESRGLLSSTSKWKPIDLANISFGQGIGVTGIQMATALSIIANGGYQIRPKLIEKIVLRDGTEKYLVSSDDIPHDSKRILEPRTVKLLTRWMEAVVEDNGTGARAKIDGFTVAGKTGTAQVIDDTGSYSSKLVNSSFVGFAPSDRPRLVGVFVFREPKGSEHGGELAGPVFKNIVSESLAYWGVEPTTSLQVAEHRSKSREDPSKADKINSVDGEIRAGFPDMRGLTMREVMRRANELSIDLMMVGSGIAVRQEKLPRKNAMKVIFENPSKARFH
ncbi:MAG: hypothetical protein KDD48_02510 [Bdellovibrionales bacterium]|nr:hypothetical protein [Bdellovibrionales bacterium]